MQNADELLHILGKNKLMVDDGSCYICCFVDSRRRHSDCTSQRRIAGRCDWSAAACRDLLRAAIGRRDVAYSRHYLVPSVVLFLAIRNSSL